MNYCPLCRADLVIRNGKDIRVQACPKCGFMNWENPVPVATGVIIRGAKLVLVKSRTRGNQWGLPSGFVEKNETAEDALIREVKEETNLTTSILGSLGTYAIDNGRKKILLIAYEAVVKDGKPVPGSEISEIDEVMPEVAGESLKGKEERTILKTWMMKRKAKLT